MIYFIPTWGAADTCCCSTKSIIIKCHEWSTNQLLLSFFNQLSFIHPFTSIGTVFQLLWRKFDSVKWESSTFLSRLVSEMIFCLKLVNASFCTCHWMITFLSAWQSWIAGIARLRYSCLSSRIYNIIHQMSKNLEPISKIIRGLFHSPWSNGSAVAGAADASKLNETKQIIEIA